MILETTIIVIYTIAILLIFMYALAQLNLLFNYISSKKANKACDTFDFSNPDEIPLDDELTYQLFQRGETNGVFQFESPGMQKNLKLLKPDKFDDLIAMNALYRPGPMEYIPNFIARKHGKEDIVYDLP